MAIKKIILFMVIVCFSAFIFCEEDVKKEPSMFVFTMGPHGILNLHKDSAPSSILFSGGFGAQIKIMNRMSTCPHVSFFASYCLVEDNKIYPAEIEHRRAYVPSLLFDIPLTADIPFENSILRVGGGASFLLRYAFVATGTDDSVAEEVTTMNSLFWKNMQFIYPSVQASWDYILDNGFAFGVGLKAYVPLSSLISDGNLQNGMISLSARFIPGK